MITPVTVEELRAAAIFDGLSDEDLDSVAGRSMKVYAREGILLIKRGESGFRFFVILDGTADVIAHGDVIASLGRGDVVGEMALVSHAKRSADVVATSNMSLATMMVWDYRDIESDYPEFAKAVADTAAKRSS